MAEIKCDQCREKFDPKWNGTKQCEHCRRWLCQKCGYGRSQCPFCGKYRLRH